MLWIIFAGIFGNFFDLKLFVRCSVVPWRRHSLMEQEVPDWKALKGIDDHVIVIRVFYSRDNYTFLDGIVLAIVYCIAVLVC